MKILHVPTDCGNHGPLIARMERWLGHDSWSLVFNQGHIGYEPDEVLGLRGLTDLFRTEYRRWNVLRRAFSYDVIFFNYGSSLAPTPVFVGVGHHGRFKRSVFNFYGAMYDMLDVRLLHRAGKTIAVIFQGGDARRADVLRREYDWSDIDEEPPGYYNAFQTIMKRRRIKIWSKYADLIYYLNPDLAWGLPRRAKFFPYAIDDLDALPYRRRKVEKRLIFGHVVNHREPKGTRLILDAVNELRLEGLDFGFIMAERIDRKRAMWIYQHVDIMIEQLVIGWYGAQAVECMAMGIPVMCFIRDKDCVHVPHELLKDLPLIRTNRLCLIDDLRHIIKHTDREKLDRIGRNGRAFVTKYHDPLKLADGLIKDYRRAQDDRHSGRPKGSST